jgi:hypothetical protein
VNGSVVPVAIVAFAGITVIDLRAGVLEGGVPAQLDNKSSAQRGSTTVVHRKLECRRPTMIENPQNVLKFLALCRIFALAQVYLEQNRYFGLVQAGTAN